MQFKVNKNQIIRLDNELLTTENVNSVECSFSFSAEYDGLELFAVFYRDKNLNRFVKLTDGKCVVPWEMLKTEGLLYIGAYGVNSTTEAVEKRMTSNAVSVNVVQSLDSSTAVNAAPSPELWEEYLAEVLEYKNTAESAANSAEWNTQITIRHTLQADASATAAANAEQKAVMAANDAESAKTQARQSQSHAFESELNARQSADQSLAYRNEAEEIKNSVRLQYDVQPDKIGVKTADEASFTYTGSLMGAQGTQGIPGPQGKAGKDGKDGADGVGIKSVTQTTTSTLDGGTNIITVTKTDGTTSTFQVQNGSKGDKGDNGDKEGSGNPIATGIGTSIDDVLVFSVTLPEITKQNGTSFIMIPDTSFSSSYIGVALKLNAESGYSVVGTYYYGDENNIGAFHPIANKPYRLMYDSHASCWIATDYTSPAKFSQGIVAYGSASAHTVIVPGVTSLSNGLHFTIIPSYNLTTGSSTLNVNGLGEKSVFVRKNDGGVSTLSCTLYPGYPYHVTYSTHTGCWLVDSVVANPVDAELSYTSENPVQNKVITDAFIAAVATLEEIAAKTLPDVTAADNGKVLRVVDGAWAVSAIPAAEEVAF